MRRDVRMGFGVGGVLLAVIIVAVLVVHRNQNKKVAFDTTGKTVGSSDQSGGLDATPLPADPGKTPEASTPVLPAKQPDAKAQPDGGVRDQWDALFASSAPQLKSRIKPSKQQPPPIDSQVSDPPAVEPKLEADKPEADRVIADPPPAPAERPRTHTIKSGETLSSIAKAVYGNSRQYKAILAANPGLDAAKLRPGTVIQLPAASAKSRESSKAADAASGGVTAVSDSKTYVVQSGDSLYKITRKLYGTSERQEQFYELNKQVIGPDSTKLKPGMVLKLPAPPAAK